MNTLMTVATAAEGKTHGDAGILGSLGIDFSMLIVQAIAFLLLLWLLSKYVFPVLMKKVEDRESTIEQSLKAAQAAEKRASSAQSDIEEMLTEARRQAKDIVSTAKEEATAMVAAADEKSKANAEHMLASAKDEINKEILSAKRALQNETIQLVADATKKVVGSVYDAKIDQTVIKNAVAHAEKGAK